MSTTKNNWNILVSTIESRQDGGAQCLEIGLLKPRDRSLHVHWLTLGPNLERIWTSQPINLEESSKFWGEHSPVYSRRLVRPSVRQSVSPSVRPIRVRPITLLFEVVFRNVFTEMINTLARRVARNIWVPTLKVKVTARPCSKIESSQ